MHGTSRRRLAYVYELCKNKKRCEPEDEDASNNTGLAEPQVTIYRNRRRRSLLLRSLYN